MNPDRVNIESTQPWTLSDKTTIYLLTPTDLRKIPKGTVVTCIDGSTMIVGKDIIDDDTRGGYLAFGVRKEQIDPVCFVENKLDRV